MQNTGIEIFYLNDTLHGNSTFDSRYKFTGKEHDPELQSNRRTPIKIKYNVRQTDYTYFGARYLDSDLSMWLSVHTERGQACSAWQCRSVDPLASKYPSLSPFAYVANNPIRLVDPDGMRIEVHITGEAAAEATQQINNQTSRRFEVTLVGKKLEYSGRARSANDKFIKKAIDDENIINIVANNSNEFVTHDGKKGTIVAFDDFSAEIHGAGSYGGSTVSADGVVNSYQYINPNNTEYWDRKVGDTRSGGFMLHELAEGFFSASIARQTGVGDAAGGKNYDEAHRLANTISRGVQEHHHSKTVLDIGRPFKGLPIRTVSRSTRYSHSTYHRK